MTNVMFREVNLDLQMAKNFALCWEIVIAKAPSSKMLLSLKSEICKGKIVVIGEGRVV